VFFSLEDFDADVYESLSDGLKNLIGKSPEFQTILNAEASEDESDDDEDDDVPF